MESEKISLLRAIELLRSLPIGFFLGLVYLPKHLPSKSTQVWENKQSHGSYGFQTSRCFSFCSKEEVFGVWTLAIFAFTWSNLLSPRLFRGKNHWSKIHAILD